MSHDLIAPFSTPTATAAATSTWTSWGISLLNGLVGDYLAGRQNGLAIDMAFYDQSRPLALARADLSQTHPHASRKVAILVHGLGCNEGVWAFRDPAQPEAVTSYGARLQADLGFTPFYLRYNTGLAVAENGKRLAALLDQLFDSYPQPIEEIVLIGHSMGGLVLRSACFYAATQWHTRQPSSWVQQVTHAFYLGSPHDGAYLEKAGHAATRVLQAIPHPIPRLIGGIFDVRSQGIKDLREGTLVAPGDENAALEAWQAAWPAADDEDVPWLPHAHHHLINGVLVAGAQHPLGALLGDGLVPPPRGLRQERDDQHAPQRPGRRLHLIPNVHHLQLVRDPAVYQRIRQGCSAA